MKRQIVTDGMNHITCGLKVNHERCQGYAWVPITLRKLASIHAGNDLNVAVKCTCGHTIDLVLSNS